MGFKVIINEIISKMDEGNAKDYYSFETFVQNLLKLYGEEKNQTIDIPQKDLLGFGDAFAPDGIGNIKGSTLIEIKFNLSNVHYKKYLDRLFSFSANHFNNRNIKNILIISAKPIPVFFIERFGEVFSNDNWPFNVIFWGPEELEKIVLQHEEKVKTIAKNLFSLRIKSIISKPRSDWKDDREIIIDNLKSLYKKGQFSLVLGAGVSSSAGMPNWDTLLNSLSVAHLSKIFNDDNITTEQDIKELALRLNDIDDRSALMIARYLRKGLSNNDEEEEEFHKSITRSLYDLRNKDKKIDSELIKAICSICLPLRTGAKVKSIITYNFDDLVERQLKNNSIMYSCIYTANEDYAPDELPIYHVHGFLPEKRGMYNDLHNSTLVFSEEGYHKIYSDPYHWTNLVQLNSFRENNCLMIGLSMSDPNLRRLLDISTTNFDRSKHFAFMPRMSTDKFNFISEKDKNTKKLHKKQVINNLDASEKFLDRHHALNDEIMKELGVNIIWYENHNEIPVILKKITNTGK